MAIESKRKQFGLFFLKNRKTYLLEVLSPRRQLYNNYLCALHNTTECWPVIFRRMFKYCSVAVLQTMTIISNFSSHVFHDVVCINIAGKYRALNCSGNFYILYCTFISPVGRIDRKITGFCRLQWPHSLWREMSSAAQTVELLDGMRLEAWMSVRVSSVLVLSCPGSGLATGLITRPRHPTNCLYD
jgi:hypothetical protein